MSRGTNEPAPEPASRTTTPNSGRSTRSTRCGGLAGRARPLNPGPAFGADPAARGAARRRDALLLGLGRTLADADTLDDVLAMLSRLSAPGFGVDGQMVFGISGKFLNNLSQHGFRPGGADLTFQMPLETGYPAAEVVRTGRAVYLASGDEYRRRFPATYPLTASTGLKSWAFLPLLNSGRISGVWLVASRSPGRFHRGRTGAADGRRPAGGAGTGADPDQRGRARAVPRAAQQHGPGRAVLRRHERGRPLRADRRRPGGGRRLVRQHRAAQRQGRAGHRRRAGPRRARGRADGAAAHAPCTPTPPRGTGRTPCWPRASRFLAGLDEDRFATCIYIWRPTRSPACSRWPGPGTRTRSCACRTAPACSSTSAAGCRWG